MEDFEAVVASPGADIHAALQTMREIVELLVTAGGTAAHYRKGVAAIQVRPSIEHDELLFLLLYVTANASR